MDKKIEKYLSNCYEKGFYKKEIQVRAQIQIFLLELSNADAITQDEYEEWSGLFRPGGYIEIKKLKLSGRAQNCLDRAYIDTLTKLRKRILRGDDENGLFSIRHLGVQTAEELILAALQNGLLSKEELLRAPWSRSHEKRINSWVKLEHIK